jgi:hypothetical protein
MNSVWASIVALFFLQGATWAAANKEISLGGQNEEKYRYEAIPIGGETSQKELTEITLVDEDRGITYISKTISPEDIEDITIHMDGQGRFISGLRTPTKRQNEKVQQEKVWLDDRKAYIERGTGEEKKRKEYELPQGMPLAVDGSLLVLLRSFPFNEGREWNVFMVDFSGYTITVTARQAGIEKVLVPAGEFECYRMEIVVDIPLFHPKVTYWLSVGKPNFLVKHQGKKGPFTPSYITSLVSFQ